MLRVNPQGNRKFPFDLPSCVASLPFAALATKVRQEQTYRAYLGSISHTTHAASVRPGHRAPSKSNPWQYNCESQIQPDNPADSSQDHGSIFD